MPASAIPVGTPGRVGWINDIQSIVQGAAGDIRPTAPDAWCVTAISTNGTIEFNNGTNVTAAVAISTVAIEGGLRIFLLNGAYITSVSAAVSASAVRLLGAFAGNVKSALVNGGTTLQPAAGEIWYVTFLWPTTVSWQWYDGTTGIDITSSRGIAVVDLLIGNGAYLRNNSAAGTWGFASAIRVDNLTG